MNWKALKQLDQLFVEGQTSSDLLQLPLGKRILDMEYIVHSTKNKIAKTNLYDTFYVESLQTKFSSYKVLIEKFSLAETNFDEFEIAALVRIENDRQLILDEEKSLKEIATLYFDSAKYLTKPSKLYDVVMKVLNTSAVPVDEHDQQYLNVLHCKSKTPKAIILCENDNQIKKPRLTDIEFWYAGGRNTAKLKFVTEPAIPFYYLCDWDNRGIEIYQSIKKNHFPNIEILVPQEPIKFSDKIRVWKTQIDNSLFSSEAKQLLEKLIPEKWIEEESIKHKLLQR